MLVSSWSHARSPLYPQDLEQCEASQCLLVGRGREGREEGREEGRLALRRLALSLSRLLYFSTS